MKKYNLKITAGVVVVAIALIFTKVSYNNSEENVIILTEEKSKQDGLIRKQSYIIQGINQSNRIWFVKDSALTMLEVNDAFVRYLATPYGLTREDFIGKTDFELWDSASALGYRNLDRKVQKCTCRVPQFIVAPFYKDTVEFNGSKTSIIFDDGTIGVIGEFEVSIKKSDSI